ncbi:SSU ribosomal protein S8P [Desulfonauticus submarinus]|uniref:Small ribosomal subunit protein uS8 n=1 Tax=Desulfonauticus submarinus TaxID=206665 RepID=A0A1H0G4W9_9BACT|nr:30S ribosomal protein S8 [Desulfonauticus submarinus]SDO01890.1 SSU ribosomal protein S8P [Desulfonauticus submarinus]
MQLTDPIADLLTRIRNAHLARHKEVSIPASKMKAEILRILKEEGFIKDYIEEDKELKVYLKYYQGKPVIKGLKKISKPSRRVYVKAKEIPIVRNGLGIAILSTPKGILEGRQARKENIGGELICEVW